MSTNAPEIVSPSPGLEVATQPQSPSNSTIDHQHTSLQSQPQPFGEFKNNFARGLFVGLGLALIVTGAAIGAGLGGTLSSCRSQLNIFKEVVSTSSPATFSCMNASTDDTGLLIDYAPVNTSQVLSLHDNCDEMGRFESIWGDAFVPFCGMDIETNGNAVGNGTVRDIMGFTAYTFMDCVNACSGLNHVKGQDDSTIQCRAVVFRIDPRDRSTEFHGNCWLKNGTLANMALAAIDPIAQTAILFDQ